MPTSLLQHLGATRTHIKRSHALIAPDGHVATTLPGWRRTQSVTLISPQMGARFSQYLVTMDAEGEGVPPLPGVERFIYVLQGELELQSEVSVERLTAHHYSYLPANAPHTLLAKEATVLTMLERRYLPLADHANATMVLGDANAVAGEDFLGDPQLQIRKLLPETPSFDMMMTTMTFEPGTPLPFVETHIMEHGLLMLRGGGIYRLDEAWYPVSAGDVMWMAPYCPQWFGALGRESACYLLYKEANRDPFSFEKES